MDIHIPDSGIIDKYENLLIHFLYHVFDMDYRHALFTDESSIFDLGDSGLQKSDYVEVARQYAQISTQDFDYFQGQKAYNKLLNAHWDNFVHAKIKDVYGINWDRKVHLLTDVALLLEDTFPERDWEQDIIFVIKMLDSRVARDEKRIIEESVTDENVVKLPVRKKPTPEEVLAGTNDFLMMKLGMSWQEARQLAEKNMVKKMEGKKFTPYIPHDDD